jgi:uncharacterized protein (UPF0303 family)
MTDLISTLEEQERRLVFDAFDPADAWRLGRSVADDALERGLGVLLDIRRPHAQLFRAALPGTAPDQEVWAARKAAVVLRMEASSALVEARLAGVDVAAIGWLDHGYALTGGSFPIRVRGAGVVAAFTASGLSSEDDHALVVEGIERYLAQRA